MGNCTLTPRVREHLDSQDIIGFGTATSVKTTNTPTLQYISEQFRIQLAPHKVGSATEESRIEDQVVDMSSMTSSQRKKCFATLRNYKRKFKFCDHVKYVDRPGEDGFWFATYRRHAASHGFSLQGGGMASILDKPLTKFPAAIKHSVSSKEISNALARLHPDNDDLLKGFPLLNFIWELKDLRRLTDLPNLFSKAGDVFGTVADKFVGTNFGVAPLISDTKKAIGLANRIDSYIDRWNDMADKGQIMNLHATIFNFDQELVSEPYIKALGIVQSTNTYHIEITNTAKVHVYFYPVRVPDSLRWKQRAKSLGLDQPLGVAWEAIPFSWFADYFLNIQEWLSQFEGSRSIFRFKVVDAGWSYMLREHGVGRADFSMSPLYDATREGILHSSSSLSHVETRSYYHREPLPIEQVSMELSLSSPDVDLVASGLSPHQGLLALGVGIGMRRR